MLAAIEKIDNGYTAIFKRHLNHPAKEVWSWLTDNEKMMKWFPELRVDELGESGAMKFDMQDGTFEYLAITDYQKGSVLEFNWWDDSIRFELEEEADGSKLIMIEKILHITDHTPKDLAGWHVCLDVIQALADGKTIARQVEWKKWYEKYKQATEDLKA